MFVERRTAFRVVGGSIDTLNQYSERVLSYHDKRLPTDPEAYTCSA